MKKIVQVLAAVAVVSASFSVFAMADAPKQSAPAQQDVVPAARGSRVIVYYFHGTFRCYTCTNMEKYSREAIGTNFKDALATGSLEFKAVNVEDKGNAHFIDDYQLYTKALILSLVRDGKEIKHKNLDQIWQLARNKEKFIEYVTSEVAGLLKDVK